MEKFSSIDDLRIRQTGTNLKVSKISVAAGNEEILPPQTDITVSDIISLLPETYYWFAHAPVVPVTFSPPANSKETAS